MTKDDEHVNTVLQVTLREGKKNPGARFHVAVPTRYRFAKQPRWRQEAVLKPRWRRREQTWTRLP